MRARASWTPVMRPSNLSKQHAVDLIVDTVMARPGEITLVAIGPLTNVALAFLREPRLAESLAGLVVMGGVVGGTHALHLPLTEHNFRSDPEAARDRAAGRSGRRAADDRAAGRHDAGAHPAARSRSASGPPATPIIRHWPARCRSILPLPSEAGATFTIRWRWPP